MTTFPELTLRQRAKAIWKLLRRPDPYVLVPIKPRGMIVQRPESYRFAAIAAVLDRHEATIRATLGEIRPVFDEARNALGARAAHPNFGEGDALSAYALVRTRRPRRIVEIGSGNSSHVLRRAGGDGLDLVCIDPEPRLDVRAVATTLIRDSVLTVGMEVFDALAPGDILFLDGSHLAFSGTDVEHVFLEILPRLRPGVIVHFHDIHLPFAYPPRVIERAYNEQIVLAALLLGGEVWAPLLPVHLCATRGDLPPGGSFWMVRQG